MTNPIISGHSIEEFNDLVELMHEQERLFSEAQATDQTMSVHYHEAQLALIYARINKLMVAYDGYDNQFEIEFKVYRAK